LRPLLFYTDHYVPILPDGHRFPMRKYRLLRERLTATGLFDFEPAPLAAAETIAIAHDPAYIREFFEGRLSPDAMRRIGFPWSEPLVERTRASVGGTIAAAHRALTHGWGGTLAGGTHHAFFAEGSGYCIFNDIVVAIKTLRAGGLIHRAAVIDLDVHQGDGTAAMLAGDPLSYTLSIHGRNNFPFHKQQSTIDIELDDGTCDEEYLERVAEALPPLLAFAPDIIFYQSGVDALAGDTLGRLSLTPEGMSARDQLVLEATAHLPLVITLGGGYSKPIEHTVDAHEQCFTLAAQLRNQWLVTRVRYGKPTTRSSMSRAGMSSQKDREKEGRGGGLGQGCA
jgi:acetoin utilization deacetylase AcuC-like enzyme